MPGTAADPVKLGPFKRLKEVHWPNKIVFRVRLRVDGTGGNGAECLGATEELPAGYSQIFTNSTLLLIDSGGDALWLRSGGEWVLSGFTVTLSGMPVLPDDTVNSYGDFVVHLVDSPWQS